MRTNRHQRTRRRRTFALVVALVVAAGALTAASTAAASQVPFTAAMTGSVSDTPCAVLTICLTGTDQGTATHLGLATLAKTAAARCLPFPSRAAMSSGFGSKG